MIHDIILFLFFLALIANAVAFVRHWYMMRILKITLNGLIEAQKQLEEMLSEQVPETRKKSELDK